MYNIDLTGKTALVTGGTRGIGRAVAEAYIKAGATVIVTGSKVESAQKAAEEMGAEKGIGANLFEDNAVEVILEQLGDTQVDILVNNAGITKDGLFIKQTDEQWNDVLNVNLTKVAALTRALVPSMTRNKSGRIINIASVVAHMGNFGQTNYVAAKAGLTGFTKALSMEVARKNVTANCIAPGFIKTDMTKDLPEKVVTMMNDKIPARRFGEAEDIANAAVFLASEGAGYVNGSTIHVNGGLYM
ncbi:MAG TPA: 3-oxoacyl-ACP reductase [Alphaproteobacteria bacterium]|nr:3-oxoacyl-ACP reductase [Alphaproteobacteria bacterium]